MKLRVKFRPEDAREKILGGNTLDELQYENGLKDQL